jgi:hypothetical protein
VKTPQRLRTPVYSKHKRMSLDAQAVAATIPNKPLYCEFSARGQRKAWAIFDPRTGRVWTRTGHPKKTTFFSNVSILIGQPPYGDGGFSVVAFGDVPLFSVRLKSSGNCPLFSFIESIFDPDLDATWAKAPGGPSGVINAGDCNVGRPEWGEEGDFKGW